MSANYGVSSGFRLFWKYFYTLCNKIHSDEVTYTRVCKNMQVKVKITSKHVALMAIFAALYFVLSLITPYIPAIGVAEIKISLEALIATIFGLILGPYLGAATALLGASISFIYTGALPTNLPFLLAPPLNALVSGLIFYKKWKLGFAVFGLLIIAFLFTPPVTPLTENWFVAIAVLF